MQELKIGAKYRHFKGSIHRVLNIAVHTETEEDLVIYQSLDSGKVWARPLQMFLEEVDHEKIKQKYRFELIEE
jgi:Uncharacterized protein conserved in bacteria